MYRTIAQVFPNNELRLTFSSCGKKVVSAGSEEGSPKLRGNAPVSSASVPPTLTLGPNSEPVSSGVKSGFGALGKFTRFGLYGKRQILRAGGAIDQDFAPEETVFLTGTLPGGTRDAFWAIAAYSSYLVDRLKSWINKYVKTVHSFYVWEYQKRGALHLHYAFVCSNPDARKKICERFKMQWYRLLNQISEKSGIDCFERAIGGTWKHVPAKLQAYAQTVRKSVAAYLSKYCSKTADSIVDGRGFAPVRWWGVSRPLLELVRGKTLEFVIETPSYREGKNFFDKQYQCTLDNGFKTFTYLHKAGVGKTTVCYGPYSELTETWQKMRVSKPMNKNQSAHFSGIPSVTSLSNQCLSIYERLRVHTGKLPTKQTVYLESLVAALRCESTSELARVSTLLCLISTLKLVKTSVCMTYTDSRMLEVIQRNGLKHAARLFPTPASMTYHSELSQAGEKLAHEGLDRNPESSELGTNPTSAGEPSVCAQLSLLPSQVDHASAYSRFS